MHTEKGTAGGDPYFTVHVDAGEVWPSASYPACIGTIRPTSKTTCITRAWVPTPIPDSQDDAWKRAVRPMLHQMAESLGFTVGDEQ